MSPTAFGPYSIVMSLGSGGMADVYLARDAKLDRLVAVKAPHRELVTAEIRARFRREAHAAAALEHPAIVPIYDYNESGELPYIVMRYLTGGSLEERIAQRPYPLADALPILERVAAALDHAHSHGIIHRDVKSANILFDEAGNAHVSDFGIAWMARAGDAGTRLTDTGVVRGTFDYISPEQARGERELDGRSDLYSLAVVLFEMLTGNVPYQAESGVFVAAQHISAPIPDIRRWRPDLPPAMTAVMRRALAKQRDERYPTGAALLADLRRAAGGERIATPHPAPAGRPTTGRRSLWLAIGAVAVLSVVVIALVRGGGGNRQTATPTTDRPEPTQPAPLTDEAVIAPISVVEATPAPPTSTAVPTPAPTPAPKIADTPIPIAPSPTVLVCPGAFPTRLSAGGQARVINYQLNVRAGPSTRFDIVRRLDVGRVVDILEGPVCDDGQLWYRVISEEIVPRDGGQPYRAEGWLIEESDDEYFLEPLP